jgi:hypothetical protein
MSTPRFPLVVLYGDVVRVWTIVIRLLFWLVAACVIAQSRRELCTGKCGTVVLIHRSAPKVAGSTGVKRANRDKHRQSDCLPDGIVCPEKWRMATTDA